MIRKFNRFLRSKQGRRDDKPLRKDGQGRNLRKDIPKDDHGKNHIIYYECKRLGQTKYECLEFKKSHSRNFKKQAMVDACSDTNES